MGDKLAEFADRKAGYLMLLLTLAGYAVGIGFNLEQLNDQGRRIAVLESRIETHVTKADESLHYQEITRRLERVEDKLDALKGDIRKANQ